MARYTGAKSRISRKFGEPIFGNDKALAKNRTRQDSMEISKEEQSNPNMEFSFKKSKKLNTFMGF